MDTELAHKKIHFSEKACLINVDIFLIASGQRGYFLEQKKHFQNEMTRLTRVTFETESKKKKWKDKYLEQVSESAVIAERLNKELEYFREKESSSKSHIECQTDVNQLQFSKMLMNHESVIYLKRLVI